MRDFKPPKDSPFLIWLARLLFPPLLQLQHPGMRFEMASGALSRFQALAGKRTIVCLNHSSHDDGEMLFGFGIEVNEEFNILTARELFQRHWGLDGPWLQRLGCYSVERGLNDFPSYKTTKELIVAGRKKLMIMPEGEISHHNDLLISLEPGTARIALAALHDLRKQGILESVYILPCAVKYKHRGNVERDLESAAHKLEIHLQMEPDTAQTLASRVATICRQVIDNLEEKYGTSKATGQSLDKRINKLRREILESTAQFLSTPLPPEASQLTCCHILHNVLYERRSKAKRHLPFLRKHNAAALKKCSRDLWRVINLLALGDNLPGDDPSQEHLYDVINVLEEEITGHTTIKGPQTVCIDVGQAIDLALYLDLYTKEKHEAIRKVTDLLAGEIMALLRKLNQA